MTYSGKTSLYFQFFILLVSCIGLLGNVTGVETLDSLFSDWPSIKILTACFFIFLVGAERKPSLPATLFISGLLIASVLFLAEYLFPFQLIISDQTVWGKRMSQGTAVLFILLTISMLIRIFKPESSSFFRLRTGLNLAGLLVSVTALNIYLVEPDSLHDFMFFDSFSLHSAACFFAFFTSLTLRDSRNSNNYLNFLRQSTPKAKAGRVLVLAALLISPVISLIINPLGDFLGFTFVYKTAVGLTLVTGAVFFSALYHIRLDYERMKEMKMIIREKTFSETELKKKNEELLSTEEELRATNEELHEALDGMQIANRELDYFSYHLSHDLRSPLAGILGLLEVMKLEQSELMSSPYFKMIRSLSRQQDVHFQQIMKFMAIKNTEPDVRQIAPEGLCCRIAEAVIQKPEESRFVFNSSVETLCADEFLLSCILENLLRNAFFFTHRSHATAKVTLTVFTEKNEIHLEVKDNGCGIREELLPKIFDMFFRGDQRSSGTGLGLYACRKAAEKMKGRLSVESIYGKGSVFRLSLPHQPPVC